MTEDVRLLLSYIENEVTYAKKSVLGGGVIVNGDTILDYVNRIRNSLVEITGERVLEEARVKADNLLKDAQKKREELISMDFAKQEAKVRAEKMINDATLRVKEIEMMAARNLDIMLNNIKKQISDSKVKLDVETDNMMKSIDSALNRVQEKIK